MATPADITRVRLYVAETDDTNGWTDQRLSEFIDEADSLYAAAAEVWEVKASTYAALVDVSESGSSRRMSSLHENAMKMADHYRDKAENASGAGAPFTVPIRRR